MSLPKISGGMINLTQRCNLACKYCFVCQQPKDATLQVVLDAIDFFARNADSAYPSVNFFGGEPMLKYEEIIVPAAKYIRKTYGEHYGISLTTNGTLLTRDVMEFFRAHDVGMLFSIDGDRETQDINRPYHGGRGSFDRLDSVIDLVLEYHPDMTFRATVEPPTHTRMAENYRFAARRGYKHTFFLPNVFHSWTDAELQELHAQIEAIGDDYIAAYQRGERPVPFAHLEEAKHAIGRIQQLKDDEYRADGLDLPACGTCGLGAGRYASIGVTGNIYSCQEMAENPEYGDTFCVGNIYTGVDDEKRLEIAHRFHTHRVKSSEEGLCDTCIKRRICRGGCAINNFFGHGDVNTQDRAMCHYEQSAIAVMHRIASKLQDNELFLIDWRAK